MSNYTVYIDEAGDLGINRGTKWFVISAVVVKKADEKSIRKTMNAIKTRLNIKEIHMRKVQDFNKRGYIVRELNSENFVYMNVIVDTQKFDSSKIPNPIIAYNFACKYLLQRVSWYLRDINETADLVLSARGTSRDNELIDYIKEKLLPYDSNRIESYTIEKITAKSAAEWDLLQLADVCATTMFLGYEVNGLGFRLPCFSYAMKNHLYNINGNVNSYGIKFFVTDMKPNDSEFKNQKICIKKERTSGTTTT